MWILFHRKGSDPIPYDAKVTEDPQRRVSRAGDLLLLVCCLLLVVGALVGGRALLELVSVPSAVHMRTNATSTTATEGSGAPMASGRSDILATTRFELATTLLNRQAKAIRERDRAAYLATIDPKAVAFAKVAARTFDNLVRMGVTEVHFGTPQEDPGALTPERRKVLGESAWVADVDLRFRLPGRDTEPWTTPLRLAFVERGGRTYVANDREGQASTGPLPLWMTSRVSAVRGEHSLVVGVGPVERLRRYVHAADEAVTRVTRVWGTKWSRFVVVIAPGSQRQMERIVGVDAKTQEAVAAVTTSVGRVSPGEASHIVLNPATFDRIGSLGRLVVLTHETTHVASGATVSEMPVWLSEGFADYVGFNEAGLTTSVIAQDFLAEVRDSGAPHALPTDADFDPQAKELDQAYEAAWTACRYITHRWDERTLVAFYRAMDAAHTRHAQDLAYANVLNTTPEDFVAGWRAYVEQESAGG